MRVNLNLWLVLALVLTLLVGVALGRLVQPGVPEEPIPFERRVQGEAQGNSARSSAARGRRVALRIWGPVCGGHYIVRSRPLPGRQSGSAAYDYDPARPYDWRRFTECVVEINSNLSLTSAERCGTQVHEVGHLRGILRHSRNPRSIMFPRLHNGNIPDACR